MKADRRRLLLGFFTLVPAGCASPPSPTANRSCARDANGPGLSYCLVGAVSIEFPDARSLLPGEALLRALDDNSAAVLLRDDQGFFALSATCPHACCTVSLCSPPACGATATTPNDCAPPRKAAFSADGTAFLCPCHGSEFAFDGSVLKGPARAGLPTVRVVLGDRAATVDLSEPVAAATRVS
jgi:nitrite reductase/ring-hydroxylating ferredoxin subunit